MNFPEKVFWFKQIFFRKNAYKIYKESLKRENWKAEQLADFNWSKRKDIVSYAYNNIKFYNKKFKSIDFHPSLLKEEKDWELVPVLERKDIIDNKKEFINPNLDKSLFLRTTTGGSTGKPLEIFRDKSFPEEIIKWRMLKRWSVSPGDHIGMLWRIPQNKYSKLNYILNHLLWWPTHRIKIDAGFIDEINLKYFYNKILKVRPNIIWGYVGAIERFAYYIKKNNLNLPKIKVVWGTAAPITKFQKKLFNSVFKAKVLNQYAFSEIHWIAANTPSCQDLVVESDFRHVDIIDNNGLNCELNQYGDMLITDFENKVFPLIKYRTGDRSKKVINKKSREIPFPLISPVLGRISEHITIPNIGVLNGEYLTTIFDEYVDKILKFQLHQKKDYSVDIKIVSNCDKKIANSILSNIVEKLEDKTKKKLVFNKIIVDDIPDDKGKLRFIISDVNKNMQNLN